MSLLNDKVISARAGESFKFYRDYSNLLSVYAVNLGYSAFSKLRLHRKELQADTSKCEELFIRFKRTNLLIP